MGALKLYPFSRNKSSQFGFLAIGPLRSETPFTSIQIERRFAASRRNPWTTSHCRFLAVVFATIAMAATASQAQTFTIIHNFEPMARPADGVVIDVRQFAGHGPSLAETSTRARFSKSHLPARNLFCTISAGCLPSAPIRNRRLVIDQEGNIFGASPKPAAPYRPMYPADVA